jgi:hypothetical protein
MWSEDEPGMWDFGDDNVEYHITDRDRELASGHIDWYVSPADLKVPLEEPDRDLRYRKTNPHATPTHPYATHFNPYATRSNTYATKENPYATKLNPWAT